MRTRSDRVEALKAALENRILLLDGAMGTALQQRDLKDADFGGADLYGCNENLIFTRPDVIEDIHREYGLAGADVFETNTFGGTPLVLNEYGLGHLAFEQNKRSAEIAMKVALEMSTEARPRWVAGSIGPTTKAISVVGGATFEEMRDHFRAQAEGLIEGGADFLLVETCQDTRNIKAALLAIDELGKQRGEKIAVAVSGTIEPMGTMLAGQNVEALIASIAHVDLLYCGLNCATGPEFMTDHIRSMANMAAWPVGCVPNAGLPDSDGTYLETPAMMVQVLERFIGQGWLNVVGGCCGTTPAHIAAFAKLVEGAKPRKIERKSRSFLSGIEYLEITDELRPVIVGERTNVIGSRAFKTMIVDEKFEEAAEIARKQVKNAAAIIDVCLANPDRDEPTDMRRFLEHVTKMVKAPLMIDSTDEKVIELSLTLCQGKSIINSINLEDGEERYEKVVPLAKKFGAALVVGCIDEDPIQAMAVTRARKLSVAERSYELLTKKYGIPEEDIYWDPLVFPCGTGDEKFLGSARETIEGVRLIKQRFPRTKTVLGISNVSFGLPNAGREVLNSVFLYRCVEAGLDLAIVNAEKLERFASIPQEERDLCDYILNTGNEDAVQKFAAHFRARKPKEAVSAAKLGLDERLAKYIVEGTKDGLVADLQLKLDQGARPLEIINGPLMNGMDEVGRLFNANELIVAEVLQSAEAMKAAVGFLEPLMDKEDSSLRGTVLLATVKGDVHDIGKNLVEIILSNNGFKVVNLGIKVPPDQLIKAAKQHNPDIIGLSGLLVKSAQEMVTTADDLDKAGFNVPILVGGAALTNTFVDTRIAPKYRGTVAYARDAMSGLDLAKRIVDTDSKAKLDIELLDRRAKAAANAQKPKVIVEAAAKRSKTVPVLDRPPAAPDFDQHILTNTPLEHIHSYINPLMLYGRHLGLKGQILRKLNTPAQRELADSEVGQKAIELWELVEAVKKDYREVLAARAMYQFFNAESDANTLYILDYERKKVLSEIIFPRQPRSEGLCLADYTNPRGAAHDNVAVLFTTCGKGLREVAEHLKNSGEYLRSHVLQALALETAEAYAELLHTRMRAAWGFADPMETTMLQRFQADYHGKRYSFGYPACPELEDQQKLFTLMRPEQIGIALTDGFMMEPEASTSAIVFHHPDARYFALKPGAEENPANAQVASEDAA
jgi:5-methyltetrahydrofolate--homocysteine methyltransferase